MPTAIVTTPRHAAHNDSEHVEQAARLDAINAAPDASGLRPDLVELAAQPASLSQILAVHTAHVVDTVRRSAAAVTRLGDVDLVICGRNSTDDESGAFAPSLARTLGWPQLTYVGKIVELDASGKRIVAERHLEEQVDTVETRLPAVVTVVKDLNERRYPSLLRIKRVAKVEIPSWSTAELGLDKLSPVATIADLPRGLLRRRRRCQ